MGIQKGTRLTDAPKDRTIRARIDRDTSNMLEIIVKKTSKSISDIVREGIESQYAKLLETERKEEKHGECD